jgi:hypothetical protein
MMLFLKCVVLATTPPEKGGAWDVARPPFIVVRLGAVRRKVFEPPFLGGQESYY